ncbi:MAG: WhiB family transcriptional regulator [Ilumatobacter sp.]|nr:MAG: WhiB family transcriptional regulator [Ilumatobacter sp.]
MKRTDPPVAADRLDWHHDAACRGELAAAFYPPLRPESKSERVEREREAKSVCRSCPVRTECLDHAVRHDERYGIWGGLTDVERRHLPRSA